MAPLDSEDKPPRKSWAARLKWVLLQYIPAALELFVQRVATMFYREIFKRNTIRPMLAIIKATDVDVQIQLLREWAQTKANESSYIQLAGGFLFTSVTSCLQWSSTQNGHWSASALFYSSVLLSLVAIVSGSQQLLLLPKERGQNPHDDEGVNSRNLAQQTPTMRRTSRVGDLDESQRQYLEKIVERLCNTLYDDRPNNLQVFALQAPLMLLSLAVVAFLAGLCSVIFAPLAMHLAWNDDAKVAVVFGITAVACISVFFSTSQMMHGVFRLDDGATRIGSYLASIPA